MSERTVHLRNILTNSGYGSRCGLDPKPHGFWNSGRIADEMCDVTCGRCLDLIVGKVKVNAVSGDFYTEPEPI